MRLARNLSSQAATLRLRRMESLVAALRMRLYAMCLMMAILAGALSVRTRHSSEDHVEHPMQAVFDHPMAADHRSDLVGQQDQRGDVEAHLTIDLAGDFARALDHDDALQTGPIMPFP